MLSLAELRRAVRALDSLAPARLQRIVQPDALSLVLSLYGDGEEAHVQLSCRGSFARLSIVDEPPPALPTPPALAQYLRAHLRGARFTGAHVLGEDRQAALHFETAEGSFDLVLALLGARSNVFALDAAGVLLSSLRPLSDTRRDLAIGHPWSSPTSAPPREGEDRWGEIGDEDYLAAIEAAYADAEREGQRDDLLQRVRQALRREAAFVERKEKNLAGDLASATAATAGRHQGELLKGVLHEVKPGDTRIVATDWESGEEIVIQLDPKLSPAANLEKVFARYQKAQKGVRALEQQLADVRARRAKADRLGEELRLLGDAPPLEQIRAFAARAGLRELLARKERGKGGASRAQAEKPAAKRGALSDVPARLRPKVYQSEGGLEIWVGRSDEANDHLTTRLARGNDLFFHVEGSPGSHVVLRTGGRKDPPSGAILDACEVAVHFSKARDDGRADVHVAAIKDVKKPRHAKPGLVQVMRGKTIHLRRDAARLQRVLSSRQEE